MKLMRSALQYGLLLSFIFLMTEPSVWADEDSFEGSANPTPTFSSDHSYDDQDSWTRDKDNSDSDDLNGDETSQKFKKSPDNDDQDFLAKDEDHSDDDSDNIDDQDKTLKKDQDQSVFEKDKNSQEKNPDSSDTNDGGL